MPLKKFLAIKKNNNTNNETSADISMVEFDSKKEKIVGRKWR